MPERPSRKHIAENRARRSNVIGAATEHNEGREIDKRAASGEPWSVFRHPNAPDERQRVPLKAIIDRATHSINGLPGNMSVRDSILTALQSAKEAGKLPVFIDLAGAMDSGIEGVLAIGAILSRGDIKDSPKYKIVEGDMLTRPVRQSILDEINKDDRALVYFNFTPDFGELPYYEDPNAVASARLLFRALIQKLAPGGGAHLITRAEFTTEDRDFLRNAGCVFEQFGKEIDIVKLP